MFVYKMTLEVIQNMMNTQQQSQNTQQTMPNMQPTDTKHGGHEVMDVHEVLSCTIATLDQYLLYKQHVKDPELTDILNRQHQFILDQYNVLVECFKSGMKPSHSTSVYNMTQNNDVVYGLTPGQPKKPIMNASEIGDECISSYMLGLMKSGASALTMASLEATNPVVRRVMADSVPNYIEMAYELFQYQNKHQYYQVPQFSEQDMQTLVNSFTTSTGGQQLQ